MCGSNVPVDVMGPSDRAFNCQRPTMRLRNHAAPENFKNVVVSSSRRVKSSQVVCRSSQCEAPSGQIRRGRNGREGVRGVKVKIRDNRINITVCTCVSFMLLSWLTSVSLTMMAWRNTVRHTVSRLYKRANMIRSNYTIAPSRSLSCTATAKKSQNRLYQRRGRPVALR